MSRAQLNKDYIKPQKSVGIVVHNTQISRSMLTEACANRNALTALAEGEYRNSLGEAVRGDVVWNWHDQSGSLDYEEADPMHPHRDNTTINAMVVVNGQGTRGETSDTIEKRVRLLGVVEVDKPEGQTRFTTVVGGIMTVRNNGPFRINTGDIVMARYPTKQNISGAARTRAERSGVVKFQLQPYRPEMHRLQVKCIWECLMDQTSANPNKLPYLDSYKRHCRQLVDSHVGSTVVMIGAQLDEVTNVLNGAGTKEQKLTQLARTLGHSDFTATRTNSNAAVLQALFVPHSQQPGAANAMLFANANTEAQTKLNTMQRQALGDSLYNLAQLVDSLNNLILGEAKSPANSGDDFSLQLKSYMH